VPRGTATRVIAVLRATCAVAAPRSLWVPLDTNAASGGGGGIGSAAALAAALWDACLPLPAPQRLPPAVTLSLLASTGYQAVLPTRPPQPAWLAALDGLTRAACRPRRPARRDARTAAALHAAPRLRCRGAAPATIADLLVRNAVPSFSGALTLAGGKGLGRADDGSMRSVVVVPAPTAADLSDGARARVPTVTGVAAALTAGATAMRAGSGTGSGGTGSGGGQPSEADVRSLESEILVLQLEVEELDAATVACNNELASLQASASKRGGDGGGDGAAGVADVLQRGLLELAAQERELTAAVAASAPALAMMEQYDANASRLARQLAVLSEQRGAAEAGIAAAEARMDAATAAYLAASAEGAAAVAGGSTGGGGGAPGTPTGAAPDAYAAAVATMRRLMPAAVGRVAVATIRAQTLRLTRAARDRRVHAREAAEASEEASMASAGALAARMASRVGEAARALAALRATYATVAAEAGAAAGAERELLRAVANFHERAAGVDAESQPGAGDGVLADAGEQVGNSKLRLAAARTRTVVDRRIALSKHLELSLADVRHGGEVALAAVRAEAARAAEAVAASFRERGEVAAATLRRTLTAEVAKATAAAEVAAAEAATQRASLAAAVRAAEAEVARLAASSAAVAHVLTDLRTGSVIAKATGVFGGAALSVPAATRAAAGGGGGVAGGEAAASAFYDCATAITDAPDALADILDDLQGAVVDNALRGGGGGGGSGEVVGRLHPAVLHRLLAVYGEEVDRLAATPAASLLRGLEAASPGFRARSPDANYSAAAAVPSTGSSPQRALPAAAATTRPASTTPPSAASPPRHHRTPPTSAAYQRSPAAAYYHASPAVPAATATAAAAVKPVMVSPPRAPSPPGADALMRQRVLGRLRR